MLTRIQIKNFKKLEDINIELGKSVVLIGPNNSGKTTALQGLVLWDVGRRLWNEKRGGKPSPEGRPGVTINRLDLIPIPIPVAKLLWHNLHVQDNVLSEGKQKTKRVLINIIVEGITAGKLWKCGLEFEYANDESFYCRPLRITDEKKTTENADS